MKSIYHYATVTKALEDLYKNGFLIDFNLQEENIKNNPHQFEIVHIYRYEGNSDPGDAAVVYGIQSTTGEKGVFVAGYSAKSQSDAAEVLAKLCIEGNDEQCNI